MSVEETNTETTLQQNSDSTNNNNVENLVPDSASSSGSTPVATISPTIAPTLVTPSGSTPVATISPTIAPTLVTPSGPTPVAHQRVAALYVGDLSLDVTESDLYELFKQAGSVQSIRVCRDSATRQSLGYAYVNFNSSVDAERGLDTLNYTPLKGKPIRISWSQRDPSLRRSNIGNTFIKNLEKDIDALALEEIFGQFGNIVSCKVQTDSEGNSLGFGFVHFEKEAASKNAIEKMNGKFLNGKEIFVGPFIPRKQRQSVNHASIFTNVYVKELYQDITAEEFEKLFDVFGKITSALLRHSHINNKPFGFVNFENHDDAVKAVEEMNEKEIKGYKLYVGRAQTKAEREELLRNKRKKLLEKTKDCNLYMRNLVASVTEKTLTEYFSKFGTVTSTYVARDLDKISKGFGFVCFSSPEEAVKVLKAGEIKLEGKPLFIAYAQRKSERRALLEAQHSRRTFPAQYPPYQRGYSTHPGYPVSQPVMPGVRYNNNQYMSRLPPVVHQGRPNPQFFPSVMDHHTPKSISDQLFSVVSKTHPDKAHHIVKIILDSCKEIGGEPTQLLANPSELQSKIEEAGAIIAKQ